MGFLVVLQVGQRKAQCAREQEGPLAASEVRIDLKYSGDEGIS